jgi:hypothetical protein
MQNCVFLETPKVTTVGFLYVLFLFLSADDDILSERLDLWIGPPIWT